MHGTLYLQGSVDIKNEDIIHLPAESLVMLFSLQAACSSLPVHVVLVHSINSTEEESTKEVSQTQLNGFHQSDGGHKIKIKDSCCDVNRLNVANEENSCTNSIFRTNKKSLAFPISQLHTDECSELLKRCALPAVVCPAEKWCVAGLAASLRFVLKQAVEKNNDVLAKKLLGFRLGCLQSCSEVSCWTRFCEVEAPLALFQSFSKKRIEENVSNTIEFPSTVLRFNNHLSKPLILHNALKKKQEYLVKTLKTKEEKQNMLSKKLHELPELEHCFAEGLDMTIADVVLFVCFKLITIREPYMDFANISPLVMKWLSSLSTSEILQRALPLIELIETSCCDREQNCCINVTIPKVIDESLYKSDPDRARIDVSGRMTCQQDISRVTESLSSLNTEYSACPNTALLQIPWSDYPKAVHPQEGNLPLSRLQRKCQQLENMIHAVLRIAKPGHKIVDFCAGGGHVALLLAYMLPKCTILMVENKSSSLERAKKRANLLKLDNVEFYQCNLDYLTGEFDVGVCLHACGQATDMVLEKCFQQKASFVCAPCCYGSIKPNPAVHYPRSQRFCELLPDIMDYLTICHAADQTHGADHPSTAQGQLCMRLVDGDRLLHAQQLGYSTELHLMVPPSCSPKNHILIGTRT